MCIRSLIQLRDVDYILPEKTILHQLSLSFHKHKTGLIGPNGIGKSTIFKLILGELRQSRGEIIVNCDLAYVPQLNHGEKDLALLSGGQQTVLNLNAALNDKQRFLLLDEPTNHLDKTARLQLYDRLARWEGGMIVISHDRKLLNAMDEIVALSSIGASVYGGNYKFYQKQSKLEQQSARNYYEATKKLLKNSKEKAQQRKERHEKNQAKGKKEKHAQIKAKGCYDKITFKSAQGKSEATHKRIVMQSQRTLQSHLNKMQLAKTKLMQTDVMSLPLMKVKVPQGKVMLQFDQVSFGYPGSYPFIEGLSFTVQGPQRLAISGDNAKGKSTILKLIKGQLKPLQGQIYIGTTKINMVDQQAHMLNHEQSVIENYLAANPLGTEKEAYHHLAHFLFKNEKVHQCVSTLSGGESIRCQLACALFAQEPPQILLLDEPSNHLDLESIAHLESVLRQYQGVLIVASHDEMFLENININSVMQL